MTLRIVDFPDGYQSATVPTFGSGIGDGTLVPKLEIPTGTVNGINDTFVLSNTPIDDTGILVMVDGIIRSKANWSLVGSSIVFGVGHIPVTSQVVEVFYFVEGSVLGGTGSVPNTEFITISAPQAAAKSVTLAHTPQTANQTLLDIVGGTAQFYGSDYTVSGAVLSWSGLALDGVLAAGDKIRVSYYY